MTSGSGSARGVGFGLGRFRGASTVTSDLQPGHFPVLPIDDLGTFSVLPQLRHLIRMCVLMRLPHCGVRVS